MRPKVFDYADYRRYLDDWFAWKKERNPRTSHRAIARRLGTSDPSVLRNLIDGRRNLTPARTQALARLMELEGDEARYFELLADFQQATTREARQLAWLDIAALRSRLRSPEIDSSRFLYLSSWVYPAVCELAQCPGFQPTPAWIAASLDISSERAAEALELLERLGFLAWEEGRLVAADPVLKTSETVSHLGSRGYHADTHELAGEALERLWEGDLGHAQRTAFLGVTIALPEERIPELRRLLWETQLKVLEYAGKHTHQADRVMQLNLQLFPVSGKLSR